MDSRAHRGRQLDPPYGLIVAASSIHWMALDRTLPRFADALAEGAMLAVLDGDAPVDARGSVTKLPS